MASHIENAMTNPTRVRQLRQGRKGFWHEASGSVFVRNPSAWDGRTTFVAQKGIKYFLEDLQ